MKTEIAIHNSEWIKDKIYTIRGEQVMLDFELAEIYGYETKRFNEQVKNNIERFDDDFRFQLTEDEFNAILRSKNSTSSWGGTRYKPYAFTEQGIYMLMTVLKGELAVAQSKMLIRMFREMKRFIQNNANIFAEINTIKQNILNTNIHQKEADKRIDELFALMDKYNLEEKQGIFFQGRFLTRMPSLKALFHRQKKRLS